ncbi:MAG TPA: hypothetical protein VIU41_12415 [Geobacteraceae bacterium]
MPLILSIVTISVYAVTGGFDFLATWDDKWYVTSNEAVQGFTREHLRQAFSAFYVSNYAPLHILSYMIDHLLWGMNPAGYHLENILLHLANGLLFYRLLRRLDMTELQAGAAAWIFLLHPAQAETVAWVSQRKSLLAMFFFLLALLGYLAFISRRTGRVIPYLLSLVCICAALLSKSVTVIFPAIALLYDCTYDRDGSRSMSRRLLDKLPFMLVAGVVAAMAILSLADGAKEAGSLEYPGGSRLAAFFTMVPVLLTYVRDCFWPFQLSPYYLVIERQTPDWIFTSSMFGVVLLVALGGFLYRHARALLFWYGLFFIALVPVLQFVPLVTLKNDRYLYTPLLGFAVLMVSGSCRLQELLPAEWRRGVQAAFLVILLALPLLAFKQTLYWRDDVTIWSHAVDVDPENRHAWQQLARGYTARSDSSNAIRAINRYHELRDKFGPVRGFKSQ